MSKQLFRLMAVFLLVLSTLASRGQTTLSAGDIAFTGYNSDGNDSFSFVLLTNISSGTVVRFTDDGWTGSAFTGSESIISWTAGSAMSAFDIVTISGLFATSGTVTSVSGLVGVSSGGDQIFVYQGTHASPSIITGIHMNVEDSGYPSSGSLSTNTSNWDNIVGLATDESNLSGTGLTNGTNCVWLYDSTNMSGWEVDNARALCSALTGTAAQVRAKLNNRAYWEFNSTAAFAPCSPICNTTTWNGSTWDNGTPNSTKDANIASSTTPGTFTCKDLIISSGVALTMSGGATATINGNVTNSGNGFSGDGNFVFNATGALSGNAIATTGVITVSSGATLTTNNLLTLSATSNSVYGQVGSSAGSISGNVTIERFLTGKRAFRFMGHPFTTSQPLSNITDDIDVTGSGGASNGFTTTASNNPSAFWFDVTTADNSTAGNNPGWVAFTTASSSQWDQYEMIRVLGRGAKGQGLTGGSYTASSATIDMTGAVNQGTQVITLTKGSTSNFVSCGNPFPSGVLMNAVTKGANIGANYYVWDATSGAAGAYVTNAFTLSYVLPPFSALFTTAIANSSNTLTFEEADKAATGTGLFKTTASDNWVELIIEDSTIHWDRLLINLDDNAMEVQDGLDATKLYNPGLDFFTLSKDDKRLAIDVRPYDDGKSIPLGLTAYNRYNSYVIKVGMFDIPAGTKLYLHDKYLNKKEELTAGFEYWFEVTSDSLSQGNARFEINMVGEPTNSITTINSSKPTLKLIPNPALDEVRIAFTTLDAKAKLQITNVAGQIIYTSQINSGENNVIVPLQNIPAGMYIVELKGGNITLREKLIKR